MTHRCLAPGELAAIRYRSRFLRVPLERAAADHRELMAQTRRPLVVVWSGEMKDLSRITGQDVDPATVEEAR